MNKFLPLLKGEIIRLWRYKITLFGLLVSVMWLLIIALVSEQEANALLPQLLIIDSGLMSILLLAASYFYEKQEGTMKAVLVSPTHAGVLLLSKVIGAILGSFISVLLLWLTMVLVHQSDFPIFGALYWIGLTTLGHISLGYVLIYLSGDFMDLLLKYTGFALLLFVPIILVSLNIIPSSFQWIANLSPTYAGQTGLLQLWQPFDFIDFLITSVLLVIYPSLLFPFYILPQFRKEAIRV